MCIRDRYHCVVQSFSYWIVLKVLAAIQFRSRAEWRNLPYFPAISQAFRHREVQKDCQNRKREIGYMPLENCPLLKTAYFQSLFSMWLWFKPNEEEREGGERELIYVGHVFVRFVERVGSGIRNAEFATLFFCYLWKIISHLQFKLILFSVLSLFFLVFSFLSVIFGHSEKRTILA